jgi:hypothetical protein
MDSLWLYIQSKLKVRKPSSGSIASVLGNGVEFGMIDDPTFASVLLAYASLRSQEKMTRRNNRLQVWLVIIATMSVIVSILSVLR